MGGDAPTPADEEAEEGGAAAGGEEGAQGRKQRRWGQHVSVAAENTQLYLLAPKTDVHGLGFDPFKVGAGPGLCGWWWWGGYPSLVAVHPCHTSARHGWPWPPPACGGASGPMHGPCALERLPCTRSRCLPPQGAEDFRRLKEQRQAAARPGQGAGDARKRRRGIAFGSGAAAAAAVPRRGAGCPTPQGYFLFLQPLSPACSTPGSRPRSFYGAELDPAHGPAGCPGLCCCAAAGVLDEEDGYGHGASLDDYVTHDDVGEYDGGA